MSKKMDQDAEAKAKADAEAKAKAEEDAANAGNDNEGDDNGSDDDGEGEGSSKTIDYKKLAEEEREKRIAAEQAIIKSKINKKHKKDDDDDEGDEDEDDDDKPLTRREARELLTSTNQAAIKVAQADRIVEIANELAETPEEAEYIIEIHKGRIFPGHLSLRDQVEEAHAIANRKKNASKSAELARALKGKNGSYNNAANTQRDGQRGTAPKLEASKVEILKRNGYTFDTTDKVYKKKLPNGKTLIYNSVTDKTYMQ